MRRLGLLLLLSASMSVDLLVPATATASEMVAGVAMVASHASPAASVPANLGFVFHRLAGRGGRRCDDPVIAQGSGGCSE